MKFSWYPFRFPGAFPPARILPARRRAPGGPADREEKTPRSSAANRTMERWYPWAISMRSSTVVTFTIGSSPVGGHSFARERELMMPPPHDGGRAVLDVDDVVAGRANPFPQPVRPPPPRL